MLYRKTADSLDRPLAYALAAATLFVIANTFPILGLDSQGNHTSTTVFGTVRALHATGMSAVAALVFMTTILIPAMDLAALLYLLVPLRLGRVPPGVPAMLRLIQAVKPWGMVEVFLLGMLVSLVKLAHLASTRTPIPRGACRRHAPLLRAQSPPRKRRACCEWPSRARSGSPTGYEGAGRAVTPAG